MKFTARPTIRDRAQTLAEALIRGSITPDQFQASISDLRGRCQTAHDYNALTDAIERVKTALSGADAGRFGTVCACAFKREFDDDSSRRLLEVLA